MQRLGRKGATASSISWIAEVMKAGERSLKCASSDALNDSSTSVTLISARQISKDDKLSSHWGKFDQPVDLGGISGTSTRAVP